MGASIPDNTLVHLRGLIKDLAPVLQTEAQSSGDKAFGRRFVRTGFSP